MWSQHEQFCKLQIYFILHVHFKERQELLMALGKGKQYREEINFIWKTAIAMQHQSSGNRCCFMYSENVIHGSDMFTPYGLWKLTRACIEDCKKGSREENVAYGESGRDGWVWFFRLAKKIDAVFILRRLQEEYLDLEKKLYMCFVDLEKKAFDRVLGRVLEWAMQGCPQVLK